MVFIISIALIIAFVVGYFLITKAPRRSEEAGNSIDNLKPVPPSRDENYRPKY